MARGEAAPRGITGAKIAIGAAFAVLCLGVLVLVVVVTRPPEPTPPPPYTVTAPEPFLGAFSAAGALSARGGDLVHRGGTPAERRRAVETALELRGYTEGEAWSEPRALPHTVTPVELAGACGIVAFVAESGLVTAAHAGTGRDRAAVGSDVLVATCGGDEVTALGTGAARTLVFTLPGLTEADALATGMPADVLLAHAEAEAALRAVGYVPTDEVVEVSAGVGMIGSTYTVTPPRAPASGCIAWVGASEGLGSASVTWPGPPSAGFLPRAVSTDIVADASTFMLFTCADGGVSAGDATAVLAYRPPGPFRVFLRAYGPPAAPGPPARPVPLTTGALRVVPAASAVLPDALPVREAE